MGQKARIIMVFIALLIALTPSGVALAQNTDKDCGDFLTRIQAQRALDSQPGDPWNLDADGDGQACEFYQEKRVNFWAGGMIGFALGALLVEKSRKKNYDKVIGLMMIAGFPVLFLGFGAGWLLPPGLSPRAVGVVAVATCTFLSWLIYGRVVSGKWPWQDRDLSRPVLTPASAEIGDVSGRTKFTATTPESAAPLEPPRTTISDPRKMSTSSAPRIVPSRPPVRHGDSLEQLAQDCITFCDIAAADLTTLTMQLMSSDPPSHGARTTQQVAMSTHLKAMEIVNDRANRLYPGDRSMSEVEPLEQAINSLFVRLNHFCVALDNEDDIGYEIVKMAVAVAEGRSIASRYLGLAPSLSPMDVETLVSDLAQRLTNASARTLHALSDAKSKDLNWQPHFQGHCDLHAELEAAARQAHSCGLLGLAECLDDTLLDHVFALRNLFNRDADGASRDINDVIDGLEANTLTNTGYRERQRGATWENIRRRVDQMSEQLAQDLSASRAAIIDAPANDNDAIAQMCSERLGVHKRHQVILDEVASLADSAGVDDEFQSVGQICFEHEGLIRYLGDWDLALALMYLDECQDALASFNPATRRIFADAQTRLAETTTRAARRIAEQLSKVLESTIGDLEGIESGKKWPKSSISRALTAHSAIQEDLKCLQERADVASLQELYDYLMGLSMTNDLLIKDLERADAWGAQFLAKSLMDEISSQEGHL